MKIAISAESTCDLNKELIEKYDIKIIPYKIILGDKTFNDGELSVEEIFNYVDNTKVLPKTTAINEYEYTEYFKSLKKEYDAVVHIALSSGITSSCGNAIRAADSLENVYVVNSKTLSTGIALLAIYARELADKGLDAKTIFEKVSKRTESLQVSFVIERLDYLYKGGRCSGFQLFGANILKIRPRIIVKDGKMTKDKMYHGSMGMVVNKYCADVLKEFNNPDLTRVFITYPTATIEMASNARQALIEAGFKEIIETRAGGTIASHCGGNTIGILYFNDGGKTE
ncbi:MAG: DegV family protein [Clostridia bacterium]|nr:DegV family protein [Clostridia bacterium]